MYTILFSPFSIDNDISADWISIGKPIPEVYMIVVLCSVPWSPLLIESSSEKSLKKGEDLHPLPFKVCVF